MLFNTQVYCKHTKADNSVPAEWAEYVKKNENRETAPGAPIAWEKASQPEEVQPGYGYVADNNESEETFYYHSDHLGSTSYITDDSAHVTQYTAYLPYGELLVDEHSSSEDLPYKFNGKELDEETGLYYYGARYMQPITSVWYGIDPLTEKYPDVSAYVYCAGNPVKLVDSDGRRPTDREAALISNQVYDGKCKLEGDWELYGKRYQLENGLTYAVYKKGEGKNTEYVLAFGGTHEFADCVEDIKQVLGMPSPQYGMAKELGEKFSNNFTGYDLTIVGHSLGGGLATVASMATEIEAITFNSAALHKNTIIELGLINAPTHQIKNIIYKGDIVTSGQLVLKMPLQGTNKFVGPRKKHYTPYIQFKNHFIKSVIDQLKK